ncbi:MAG: hypothetical protein ACP5Q1_08785 [Anaerolineae bacterium]
MRDWVALRERYERSELPIRLGGLAANLARICSFSDHPAHSKVVEDIVDETKFLIEWVAPNVSLDVQAALVELQVQLARWQRKWPTIWHDPQQRKIVAEQSRIWSQRVLQFSGLLS